MYNMRRKTLKKNTINDRDKELDVSNKQLTNS